MTDTQSATGNARNADASADIVVTANKREQSLRDVGMSISAVGGDQLRSQGITDVKDLVRVVPGLTFAVSQKGAPVYTIRGVGYYEESLAASPAVSVYVDQIGYSFPIEAKAAGLDLERVEVLKGPQGTLYGQSSTGGAINYMASPQALYAEQRFSGHNVNIGVRQRREGTGRGFRG